MGKNNKEPIFMWSNGKFSKNKLFESVKDEFINNDFINGIHVKRNRDGQIFGFDQKNNLIYSKHDDLVETIDPILGENFYYYKSIINNTFAVIIGKKFLDDKSESDSDKKFFRDINYVVIDIDIVHNYFFVRLLKKDNASLYYQLSFIQDGLKEHKENIKKMFEKITAKLETDQLIIYGVYKEDIEEDFLKQGLDALRRI